MSTYFIDKYAERMLYIDMRYYSIDNGYSASFDQDFFSIKDLPYNEMYDAYVVNDIDYIIEAAKQEKEDSMEYISLECEEMLPEKLFASPDDYCTFGLMKDL